MTLLSWAAGAGRSCRPLLSATVTWPLVALLAVATPGAAQEGVGTPPSKSPFRDLVYGMNVTALAGYLDGGGGKLGLGPQDAWMYGLRYQLRATKFISLGAEVLSGVGSRNLIDPDDPDGNFLKGKVDQRITIAQALLQLNLTAGKTWHRLAPYFGVGLGAAFGGSVPQDTSGYEFGTEFVITPYAGVRIMPNPRFGFAAEARAPFWKLSYPGTLRDPDDPQAVAVTVSEWVVSGWYLVGVVIAF
jgi:hypothetical protein